MSKNQIKEKILKYITDNTFAEKGNINDNTQLFDEGVFDSMGLVMLISFLEEEFDLQTNDTDLILENFESINAITKYVLNRKGNQ
jgi:acyl carrier protein